MSVKPDAAKVALAVLVLFFVQVVTFRWRPSSELEDKFATARSIEKRELPMSFVANHGQTDASVKFVARGVGYGVFLTSTGATLALLNSEGPSLQNRGMGSNGRPVSRTSSVLRMELVGADTDPQVSGINEVPGMTNYFLGNNPQEWRTDIPTYAKVHYRAVYPGIDLVYYGRERQLEYDFIVAPGAHPGAIRLHFEGIEGLMIDADGNLVGEVGGRSVRLLEPTVYQEVTGKRHEVSSEYVFLGEQEVGFRVGPYDIAKTLVIDPVFSYSTFLGGSSSEMGRGITVDASGNAYVTGETASINFPTRNPLQSPFGGDIFVSKFETEGSALVYSTYLGGDRGDSGSGIAVDNSGNVYVTGYTLSTDFPTVNPLQRTNGGNYDAFVSKLSAEGSALVYSTYLGGGSLDTAQGIAVDPSGNAYVTGHTMSVNFPTANALQPNLAATSDAFVTKLNAAGSALVYSTYLGGGGGSSGGTGIAVDPQENAYLTGSTTATNFPIMKPLQPSFAGRVDAFVSKLNAAGSAFVYSTYLGGSDSDSASSIAIDSSGNAYVTGQTFSSNYPTTNALQPATGGHFDVFVTKLAADGTAFVYSTYLGGSSADVGHHIAVDGSGNAYVTGQTTSIDFPTAKPLQPAVGGSDDAFVTKFDAAGSILVFSSYLGGRNPDEGHAIAVDGFGNAYLTGITNSPNFPMVSPLQPVLAGGDAFVTKIADLVVTGPPTLSSIQPRRGAQGTNRIVRIGGANFVPGSGGMIVTVSGTGVKVGPVRCCEQPDGVLTTTFEVGYSATPGKRIVTVRTAGGASIDGIPFIVFDPLFPGND
jgi:hypothetical protein